LYKKLGKFRPKNEVSHLIGAEIWVNVANLWWVNPLLGQ